MKISLLLLLSALIGGCMPNHIRSTHNLCDGGNTVFISEVEILLCYYESAAALSDSALEKEYKSVQQSLKLFALNRDRIRLAILHATPNTHLSNPKQTLELIQTARQHANTSSPSVRHLLFLISSLASGQIELKHGHVTEPAQTDISNLKKRMHNYNLRQKLEVLEQALLKEKNRSNELSIKLNALRQIDSSIDARKQPAAE